MALEKAILGSILEQYVDLLMTNWREREKRRTLTLPLDEDWDVSKLRMSWTS